MGVIEETGKGLVLLAVAHTVHHREPRDGMLLGAVVGAGFASFESAGYALQTMLEHLDDHTIADILETEAFRGVLAPFGHITWTALLGGALFASSRGGRFRVTTRLAATFVGVIALHALWDQTYGWAIMFARAVTGDGWELAWPNAQAWITLAEPGGARLVQRVLQRPARAQRARRGDVDRDVLAEVRPPRSVAGPGLDPLAVERVQAALLARASRRPGRCRRRACWPACGRASA